MKIQFYGVVLWVVSVLLVIGLTSSYLPEAAFEFKSETSAVSYTYEYDRINEVKKECASVLSSASEFKLENSKVYSVKEELSFANGDWRQDGAHRSKKSVSINGFLVMGTTWDGSFTDVSFDGNPQFQIFPSHSQLSMAFQGIYTESKKNGGERVVCLLGNAMLPTREADPANPWEWMKVSGSSYDQPPLSEDDRILLVLRYPITFTLTNRMIHGELRSLNSKSNPKYFDMVQISSQLGKSANYEFGSKSVVSRACDPYPYPDSSTNGGIDIYKGLRFCEILDETTREQAFTVVPNWRCNNTDEFCRKLGPFVSDEEIKDSDGGFRDVKIYMQNVKCEQATARGDLGMSNMTLAAEGIWKSSSGQLCMVGCLGFVDAEGSSCNSRICLYMATSFSIKQRSIIFGRFSPVINSSAYFPLSFEKLVEPSQLWNYFKSSRPNYSYSKLDSAGTILEKNEPFSFGTVIKKSLLVFPKLEDAEAYEVSLSLLSEDLSFHVSGHPDPMPNTPAPTVYIWMEILSVGPLFGSYYAQNASILEEDTPYHTKAEYTEKQLLVNVSAQLSLSGKAYTNLSMLFLEGLYDPHVGKMYLVGCRDVRASWKVLFDSQDLEAGLDCLIEVVVSYPPTTARWLVNPTARISITSQRTEDDPLHFKTIRLQTFPLTYRKQREDILSRRGFEGILRILTLSLAIGSISSQLFYIKYNADFLPYISLVMLGVQALGYSVPLVTGAEALFKRMAHESYDESSYNLENSQWIHIIDYSVKLLVMVSLLLTLRLCQKVWKSRTRLLTRAPLEPHRVPSDKRVLLSTFTIHVIGYVIVLIIHSARASQRPLQTNKYSHFREDSNTHWYWETELEEYVGLVQDFFLFPQIIGNFVWQIDCKPLRKLYFIGITVVRLLPHVYDYIRAPVQNPYVTENYEFVNPSFDFYSKFGDIAIPVTAIILALTVYLQQRWSYEKLSQTLMFRRHRLLPQFSRMYERLPSKSFEAELVSDVNNTSVNEKENCDVE
ncbi:DUF2921 family protein [Quillaja saponaria]|uniref:RING-type E3 ubiquitin transferase n=1 Tax=Quillaja saponaria TaxID=32244 RepID=A0AAD7LRA9_QUISA|nr:DUF2921 family protein [Quillaja saponaria]